MTIKNSRIISSVKKELGIIIDYLYKCDLCVEYQDYAINKRRGQINIDFANELWTVISHARLNDDNQTKITYILNQILDKFIEAGCWTSHSIEIENETNSGFDIRITTMNSASNEQNIYYIPYNKIWSENEI